MIWQILSCFVEGYLIVHKLFYFTKDKMLKLKYFKVFWVKMKLMQIQNDDDTIRDSHAP